MLVKNIPSHFKGSKYPSVINSVEISMGFLVLTHVNQFSFDWSQSYNSMASDEQFKRPFKKPRTTPPKADEKSPLNEYEKDFITLFAKENIDMFLDNIRKHCDIRADDNLSEIDKKRMNDNLDLLGSTPLFRSLLLQITGQLAMKDKSWMRGSWPRDEVFKKTLIAEFLSIGRERIKDYTSRILSHSDEEGENFDVAPNYHIMNYPFDSNLLIYKPRIEFVKRGINEYFKFLHSVSDLQELKKSLDDRIRFLNDHEFKYGECVRYNDFYGKGHGFGYVEELYPDGENILIKPIDRSETKFLEECTRVDHWNYDPTLFDK